MPTRDRAPELPSDLQFPFGSASCDEKEWAAENWLNRAEHTSNAQLLVRAEEQYMPLPLPGVSGTRASFRSARELCEKWDEAAGDSIPLATTGLKLARLFSRATQYLPGVPINLSDTLTRMQEPDEQLHYARFFAHSAWAGMQNYPHVYDNFTRLVERSRRIVDLSALEDEERFRAGVALPYMLSVAAQLALATPNFSGMKKSEMDLSTTPLEEFFTNECKLAPDVVLNTQSPRTEG